MEKIQDPAGIRTQDLLNTSQTLLPLSHLDPPGGAALPRGLSQILTDSHKPDRVRTSLDLAEASRKCCLCSLSSTPLPGVQVAYN